MRSTWSYIKRCENCGEKISYGVQKSTMIDGYKSFEKVIRMQNSQDFRYCGECHMMTLQITISYDLEENDAIPMICRTCNNHAEDKTCLISGYKMLDDEECSDALDAWEPLK